jgi:C4-dicarboxylate transporter DctM subunit
MLLTIITLLFFGLALAGIPLVYSLLLTTVGVIWGRGLSHPLETIFLTYIGGVEPFVLIAVPLFIVSGDLLSRGGVGKRIVDFAQSLFGCFPGGLGIVTVTACLLFGGVSGSAIAGSAAIGSVMIPAMLERGYSRAFAGALISAAGTLAVIIPPSIPLLVFGFVSGASVRDLFLSGVVPGILFGIGMMGVCVRYSWQTGVDPGGRLASKAEIWRAFKSAFPALLMPLIILGGIWTGWFTPTEAAAVATIYGLFISTLVYRDLRWSELPGLILHSFITSAVVMVVIGATAAVAWVITAEQIPLILIEQVKIYATSKWAFLLIANVAMLLLGIFIEPLPAMILSAPLFIPLATAFHVDLVHLGLIVTCNLAIGLYTPPVGGTLFLSAKLANAGIGEVSRALIPLFVVTITVLFIVTYIPVLPMGLVWLFR